MQGMILAAGRGSRLDPLTRDRTKAMIEVAGRPLVERAILSLSEAGANRIVVVIGHAGEHLRGFLLNRFPDLELVFVENEEHASTNNIYSLWLARDHLGEEDTLLLESDVIFAPELLREAVADERPDLAVVAPFRPWMDGTVTRLDGEGAIEELIPRERIDWARSEEYFKTVNLYKLSREYALDAYVPTLERYVSANGGDAQYETVMATILETDNRELAALVTDEDWYEIDDHQDLAVAETLFAPAGGEREALSQRFGGYWRFPALRDHCYISNPFFPPAALLAELEAGLEDAIRSYPSGRRVIDQLGAAVFGCRPEQLVVGGGASELIRLHLISARGRVGIACPTFDEYLESVPTDRVERLEPTGPDLSYSAAELEELARSVETLILVNPDNPSGHFLPVSEVLALAARTPGSCRLLIDESFVDVVDDGGGSLINPSILDDHPDLVVIKSIGKSYGTPGARLGVLASGDTDLVAGTRERLPIWNVNSLAERLLQALPRYRAEHAEACELLRRERARVGAALAEISFLRVIPSQSMFFLCEVRPPLNATTLTDRLLGEHRILIKDCTGKAGIEGHRHCRIALRGPADNDMLLAALQEIDRS